MRIPGRLMTHGGLVTYRAKVGTSGSGPVYGPEVTPDRAEIQEGTRLVVNAVGKEVVAAGRVWLDPEHNIPEDSEVTVWVGTPRARTAQVVASAYHQHDGLPEHVELSFA